MFQRSVKLIDIFGFEVRIDLSWLILAVLVVWTLARGVFPQYYPGLTGSAYWWMGVVGALGLFFSIVFHEISHSLVARRYGLPMKGITLFIFGGVAEMGEEPSTPRTELLMAIAGPVSSLILGACFYALRLAAAAGQWATPLLGVLGYLAFINLLLAGFNLLPAFPLDGGRVLRSILWRWRGNLRWATAVAARIGSGFGTALIFLGLLTVLRGDFIGGIWWVLIGMFLQNASRMSYRQVLMRRALEGETVARFMNPDPVTVSPDISIEELVNRYVYHHHFKMYPVTDGDSLLGCVTLGKIKEIPREEWARKTVRDLMTSCSRENTISPGTDAMRVLTLMNQAKSGRMMVVDGDKLVGVITLKDLLDFFSIKLDLEGTRDAPGPDRL